MMKHGTRVKKGQIGIHNDYHVCQLCTLGTDVNAA